MSSCSLSYLGGVFDRAATILCGSDAVTDPVTGWIIKMWQCSLKGFTTSAIAQWHGIDLSITYNLGFQPTLLTLGETIILILYPQHRKTLSHLICVYDGCGMQFERFYNLSHSAVTWFWLIHHLSPRISAYSLNTWGYMMCGGNGVRGHPYTYPQHRMTPNHLLSVSDVCEMQLERFYSLSHSAVAWSRHVINLTGIRL